MPLIEKAYVLCQHALYYIDRIELAYKLALVFIGGAAGKFFCGWLDEHMGVIGTVLATEGGTVAPRN